jgi:hypothetical protein
MDPLSITVSVTTLLGTCISVGVSLRKFLIATAESKTAVTAMITDVKALRSVLELMETTFEEMNSDKPESGHIGTHWSNLFQSLADGQGCLIKLKDMLDNVNKDTKVLDGVRRQIRLKTVTDQIVHSRQEVQTYKDALQLSLQTIQLYAI